MIVRCLLGDTLGVGRCLFYLENHSHYGNNIFPPWEWNVPCLGTKHSHTGNIFWAFYFFLSSRNLCFLALMGLVSFAALVAFSAFRIFAAAWLARRLRSLLLVNDYFRLFSIAFFFSLASLRSTFFTSSSAGKSSGMTPRSKRIRRTAALLSIYSCVISVLCEDLHSVPPSSRHSGWA